MLENVHKKSAESCQHQESKQNKHPAQSIYLTSYKIRFEPEGPQEH